MSKIPDPQNDHVIRRTEQLLKLCQYLFHETYCTLNDIPKDKVIQVPVQDFVMWLHGYMNQLSSDDECAICEAAGVEHAIWDFLYARCHEQDGVNQLAGVWPQIALSSRGKPKDKLESMHMCVTLRWKDGRVVPVSAFVPCELASSDAEFTDGIVCTLIQSNAHGLMQVVRDIGLDDLHDKQATVASDAAYEQLMGLVILCLEGAKIIRPGMEVKPENVVELAPEAREAALTVKMLIQKIYRPPMDPGVRSIMQQLRARKQQKEQQATFQDGEARGGWA